MAKTKTFHDQYLENYLYRINNDVDGGVDGDEKVADVGQHCHLRRPGVCDHLLLTVESWTMDINNLPSWCFCLYIFNIAIPEGQSETTCSLCYSSEMRKL